MPNSTFASRTSTLLTTLTDEGQYKYQQYITSPMGPTVDVEGMG
jgi:hypothetical protein